MRKIIYCLLFIIILLILPAPFSNHLTLAATVICSPTGTPIVSGLLSTANLEGTANLINSSGACVIDNTAPFSSGIIPKYADLLSSYYTQSKAKTSKIDGDGSQSTLSAIEDTVYYITGNFTLSGNPTGTKTYVVFIDHDLNINKDYIYDSSTSGTVFIVQGNVNIDPLVTRIDAVIIAGGTIYTAGANCSSTNKISSNQLVVNGSLIALTDTADTNTPTPPRTGNPPIQFCRILSNNTAPAELINHQVKYLVILRNLMSDTVQKWSESYE